MWQFLLAAAVAGSGFVAKRLFTGGNGDSITGCVSERIENFEVVEESDEQQQEQQSFDDPLKPQFSISPIGFSPFVSTGLSEADDFWNCETTQSSTVGDDGIFRFSSLDCGNGRLGEKPGLKSSRKKSWVRGKLDGFKGRVSVHKQEKKLDSRNDKGMVLVVEQRKKGRRLSFCLKKRRTSKNANSNAKCGSCSITEGSSSFGWGLGLGIMYMVSAGKEAQINKLNAAVDETAKVVQELKAELHKRKLSRDLQFPNCMSGTDIDAKKIGSKHSQPDNSTSKAEEGDPHDSKILGLLSIDSECAGSVLTEEPEPQMLKLDQLEAEFESELQKIPWCTTEIAYFHEESRTNLAELDSENLINIANTEFSAKVLQGQHEPKGMDSNYYPFHGVSPTELDQKLCHLLIEQQESHIMELESELHVAQGKLHEKEVELQALKDCVRGFTELSLATASDEETDTKKMVQERSSGVDDPNKMGLVEQKSLVGMKRMMELS